MLCACGLSPSESVAGLAKSDVVVVVNGDSANSRTLANHYVAMRGIPPRNVIVLRDIPDSETTDVETFRTQILRPLLAEIDARKIATHVQCIAYSADFPTGINIKADIEKLGPLPKQYTAVASINALTFFYQLVLEENPNYIDLAANRYARRPIESYFSSPVGAKSDAQWNEILNLIVDGEHAKAAESLVELFKEQPHQFPMAYLAAAQYAQAEMPEQAIKMLQAAVTSGWSNADFLAQDKRFDALRDSTEFQIIELTLEQDASRQSRAFGFDAKLTWTPNGVRTKDPKLGFRYLMSVVLGVTRGQGTSLEQAITILNRAAAADYTRPEGTFYFTTTADVRTTTRQGGFLTAIDQLEEMGFAAKLEPSALPQNAPAVLGAQIGVANFDWPKSGSKFVPGAIADNLTSFGGVMNSTSQTKLTQLLIAGAAGSSGAVTEPYALQEKFPHPQMYVQYARGASLAEAFYLSVTGPYQLLIVGDPLCQPFANAPQPELATELKTYQSSDALTMNFKDGSKRYADWLALPGPRAKQNAALAPVAISLLTDGINPRSGRIQDRVAVKLAGLTPGYHELTIRLVADDPFSQRSDFTLPVIIDSADTVSLQLDPSMTTVDKTLPGTSITVPWLELNKDSKALSFQVVAAGAQEVSLLHDHEELGTQAGESASFTINPSELGQGPVRIWARAKMPDDTQRQSLPMILNIGS